ncbi:hypothetical protein TOTORO_01250 [Serratia phage vB_SmaS-Totoro]|nr:hypothetical protein TOTORO_01250 [Serratia phage vB_SmaS-Totoro]
MKKLIISLALIATSFFSAQASADMVLVSDKNEVVTIVGDYVSIDNLTCKFVFVKERTSGYKCSNGDHLYLRKSIDGNNVTVAMFDAVTDKPTYIDVYEVK